MGNGSGSGHGGPDELDGGDRIERLEDELDELRRRVELVERGSVRAERLEFTDANGAVRLRLGYLGDEDVVGMECRRANGSLSGFFGHVAGEGSVMFTGGRYDQFVLELGASELGAHLRVGDPDDPDGAAVTDVLGRLR